LEQVGHVLQGLDDPALGDRLAGQVLLGGVGRPEPGVAEEPPARLVAVAAVDRVGEQPLLEMRPERGEERPLVGNVAAAGQPGPASAKARPVRSRAARSMAASPSR